MYINSWNKGTFYWLTENEYGVLPLLLPLGPVNEKKSILYSKVEINSKVTLEFRSENVCF